jgi:hypothetical protein
MTQQTMEVKPTVSGKASTALQLLAVTVVLVTLIDGTLIGTRIEYAVFYATGAVTTLAGLQYMYRGLAWLNRQGEPVEIRPHVVDKDEADRRRA